MFIRGTNDRIGTDSDAIFVLYPSLAGAGGLVVDSGVQEVAKYRLCCQMPPHSVCLSDQNGSHQPPARICTFRDTGAGISVIITMTSVTWNVFPDNSHAGDFQEVSR